MNEDLGSMAQQALSGVNGNINSPVTPTPTMPEQTQRPTPKQDSLTVAIGALNRLSRGVNVVPPQGVGNLGAGSLSNIMEHVKATTTPNIIPRADVGTNSAYVQNPAQTPMSAPANGNPPRVENNFAQAPQQNMVPMSNMGMFAQQTGISMRPSEKPGGAPEAAYDYRGVTVRMPRSINLADDNAVRAEVERVNRDIDLMEDLYSED